MSLTLNSDNFTNDIFSVFCFVPLAPSHPYDPTTFVELLPMLSPPSLYGRMGGDNFPSHLPPARRVAHQIREHCSVRHSCALRYDSCEDRGGEIICMIGSPRPPMYSPPSTWGAPLLQMSLPQNKTMGEKSGLTLGSLVTAAGRAFMQEL